jgi:hypothetical protein
MNFSAKKIVASILDSRIPIASLIFGVVIALPVCAKQSDPPAGHDERFEEIYVLRSIRDRQEMQDGRCTASAVGFDPHPVDADRRFSFWSIESRPADGLIVDAAARRVAELRGCFGPTDDKTKQNFHAEIRMGSKAFRGRGECQALLVNFPEEALIPVRCQIVLSDLSAPYIGGLLITNTLTSGAPYGGETSPPGYTQASIAIIRLWRKH